MKPVAARNGNIIKLGLGALAIVAVAAPVASALASAEEPATAAAALSAEQVEKGRKLFNDNSCSSCHTLADASASGTIGPAFDGNAALTHDFAVDRITNGQGAMPSFGWMDAADIDLLASYIVQAKK